MIDIGVLWTDPYARNRITWENLFNIEQKNHYKHNLYVLISSDARFKVPKQ